RGRNSRFIVGTSGSGDASSSRSRLSTYCRSGWQVARTADFAVRVFSVAIIATVPYSIAVSKLRRPFLSAFFIAERLLRRREKFTEPDFALLARPLTERGHCTLFACHHNPVRAGLVSRPEDWRWSSYNEDAGMSADEQNERCGLTVDRVRMPSEARARI